MGWTPVRLWDRIGDMDPKTFWAIVAFSFALLFSSLLYAVLAPFLPVFLWAGVVGIPTYPLYERLARRMPGREGLAAGLSTLIVLLLVVVPVTVLLVLLGAEAGRTYRHLEEAAASGTFPGLETIRAHPSVAPWIERGRELLARSGADPGAQFLPLAKRVIDAVLRLATSALKNLLLFLVQLLLMLVVLFFLYRDGDRLSREFWALVPLPEEEKRQIREGLARVVTAVVVGILGTCLAQGILGGIGFLIAGLPSPVLFGSLMAFAALIPVVGTALVWLPGAAYLLLAGKTVKGIFLILWGAVAVSSADNLIRPLLISGKAQIPLPLVALGAIGGFLAFGLAGVVVGPLIVSMSLTILSLHKARAAAAVAATAASPSPDEPGGAAS